MAIKLSTKGRYGVRAMVDLAAHHDQGPVFVRTIAVRQEISAKYLHALLASLKGAKLVRSVRGSSGGYTLARAPQEITLSEIIEALEGPFAISDCVQDGSVCERASRCAVRDVWQELSELLESAMAAITLGDLLQRQLAKEAPSSCDAALLSLNT
jgi:Rrf2 family transcriptional regulator, cysteine metabolism repressor